MITIIAIVASIVCSRWPIFRSRLAFKQLPRARKTSEKVDMRACVLCMLCMFIVHVLFFFCPVPIFRIVLSFSVSLFSHLPLFFLDTFFRPNPPMLPFLSPFFSFSSSNSFLAVVSLLLPLYTYPVPSPLLMHNAFTQSSNILIHFICINPPFKPLRCPCTMYTKNF